MISAQTRSAFVARGKPLHIFPDHALASTLAAPVERPRSRVSVRRKDKVIGVRMGKREIPDRVMIKKGVIMTLIQEQILLRVQRFGPEPFALASAVVQAWSALMQVVLIGLAWCEIADHDLAFGRERVFKDKLFAVHAGWRAYAVVVRRRGRIGDHRPAAMIRSKT